MNHPIASVRCQSGNENHHLWNNNGTWWCHFTVHLPDFTKHRIRLSLETPSLREARQLRDALLALFGIDPSTLAGSDAAWPNTQRKAPPRIWSVCFLPRAA